MPKLPNDSQSENPVSFFVDHSDQGDDVSIQKKGSRSEMCLCSVIAITFDVSTTSQTSASGGGGSAGRG